MKINKLLILFLVSMLLIFVSIGSASAGDDNEDKELVIKDSDGNIKDKEKNVKDADKNIKDSDEEEDKDSGALSINDFVDIEESVEEGQDSAMQVPAKKITSYLIWGLVILVIWALIIKGIKFLSGNSESASDAIFGIIGIVGVVMVILVALNTVFSVFSWNF
jgi:hypothetical protein